MNVRIDKAGRIVVPKRLRERFRLRAGTTLELEEHPEGLMLRRSEQGPSMVRARGKLVHLGKLPQGFDWDSIVDDERDERIRDLSGL